MSRELLILIAILVVAGVYLFSRQRDSKLTTQLRQKMALLEAEITALKSNSPDEKISALEQRIQVLEAIVTDEGFDLKREIDSL